ASYEVANSWACRGVSRRRAVEALSTRQSWRTPPRRRTAETTAQITIAPDSEPMTSQLPNSPAQSLASYARVSAWTWFVNQDNLRTPHHNPGLSGAMHHL